MNKVDFMSVAKEILRNSCNQLDDVKAAFRVFDYDNGNICQIMKIV